MSVRTWYSVLVACMWLTGCGGAESPESALPEQSTAPPVAPPAPAECEPVAALPDLQGLPPCGEHPLIAEQKSKHEVPLLLEPDAELAPRLAGMELLYAFDCEPNYGKLPMALDGGGYRRMIGCIDGMGAFDPYQIRYFIVGEDGEGRAICAQGTNADPLVVVMTPHAGVTSGPSSMPAPRLCEPCDPAVDCR